MSYCRWSSDDFGCDVYVYEDCNGGWTTHVAASRYVGDIPCPSLPSLTEVATAEFMEAYQRQRAWIDAAHLERIGLPQDGKSFNDPTPGACANRLRELKGLGYQVPDYAIVALDEEQAEHDSGMDQQPAPQD